MSGTVAWICPYCHGRVRSTRDVDMATSISHHISVCPQAPLPAAPAMTPATVLSGQECDR